MLSIPNIISLVRVFATIVVAAFILKGQMLYAATTFAITCWTDWADGYFARKLGQYSLLGQYLDPIADKIFLTGVFAALAFANFIPIWLFCLVITRDILLVLGAGIIHVNRIEISLKPIFISKVNTVAQMFLVVSTLFFNHPVNLTVIPSGLLDFVVVGFAYLTIITTFLSGISYAWITAVQYSKLLRNKK